MASKPKGNGSTESQATSVQVGPVVFTDQWVER